MIELAVPPRLFDCPAADYHRDEVGARVPTLNHSVARAIIGSSPLHAFHAHPKLNPAWQPEDPTKFDLGKVAHALVLRDDGATVQTIDADDYRTADAKAARAEAIAAGKLPCLVEQYERAAVMAAAVRQQLDEFPEGEGREAFTGKAEQTLVWQEGAAVCRARFDDWPDPLPRKPVFYDLKTTESAAPEAFLRRVFQLGHDTQGAFYLRGAKALTGLPGARFRFVVVEVDPPHALSIVELEPAALAHADAQIGWAIEYWASCLQAKDWPGYPRRVVHLEAPAYSAMRFEDRKMRVDVLGA